MSKFKKDEMAITKKRMDLRKTGGPNIPSNTIVRIVRRRRVTDPENGPIVWVDAGQFGCRNLYEKDLAHIAM